MALDKEQFLLETLISNSDLFIKCNNILQYEYFQPEFQSTVKFIKEYNQLYNGIPALDMIEAETGLELKTRKVTKDISNYVADEVEEFCKAQAFEIAIGKCIPLMDEGKRDACIELMKDALLVSLDKDLGINYFEDPETRLRRLAENQIYQTTGYPELDELLGGGLVKGQMIVFSGNSGAGKSMTLSNIGLNMLEDGKTVLYISLELSEDLIFLRHNGLLNGHDQAEWKYNIDETVATLKGCKESGYGDMFIKYMHSGTNANAVRAYIQEFQTKYGDLPDVLLLDYLDIAGANNNISADNVSLKDKHVSEEFRNLVNEYDMYFLTASQQNRSAIGIDIPDQSHIAGGLTKANTSDFWFAIIASDAMKAEGIIKYQCIKARSSDGVGKGVLLKWIPGSSRITNMNDPSANSLMDFKSIDRKKPEPKNKSHSNGGFDSKLIKLTN